jgi:rhodanese-related sulfurtransferase
LKRFKEDEKEIKYTKQKLCMFWFTQNAPPRRVGFDDVLLAIQHPETYMLINTLPAHQQSCLIQQTTPVAEEEVRMNQLMSSDKHHRQMVIVYGKNGSDVTVDRKCQQLSSLGFREVFVYSGGMLEWMLLQDVFGYAEFPTTSRSGDIFQFQADSVFKIPRLTNF